MTSRALVLGGGGVTGVAWQLGMLRGLADAGVDLTGADLVVGTSAGAVVGAQITSGTPLDELYARQLADPSSEVAARLGLGVVARYAWAMLRSRDQPSFRRRLGAAARRHTAGESQRKAVIAARLPVHAWPARPLRVTAVDTGTGEFATFDRDSGVDLVDAVAASCAVPLVWPPVSIGGRRFMDGGLRSAANADLAAGHDRVVVLAPLPRGAGRLPSVAVQAGELRRAGAQVVVVSPDPAARVAIGRNVLDPARRPAAARAGLAQAAGEVDGVRAVWAPAPAGQATERA